MQIFKIPIMKARSKMATPSHATPSIRGSAEGQFTSLASSSSAPSSSSYPIKKRSLRDIYEKTKETNLFSLYVEPKPLTFQEAVREDQRIQRSVFRGRHVGQHSSFLPEAHFQKKCLPSPSLSHTPFSHLPPFSRSITQLALSPPHFAN